MEVRLIENRFGGRIMQVDDARIKFRNFEGREDKFNREGDRNFHLVIPDEELADMLVNDKNADGIGWNVRVKEAKDPGDPPYLDLKVKVSVKGDNYPTIRLVTNGVKNVLEPEDFRILDKIAIDRVDMDIRAFDSDFNGKPFRSAYLQSMLVYQGIEDRFADEYDEE